MDLSYWGNVLKPPLLFFPVGSGLSVALAWLILKANFLGTFRGRIAQFLIVVAVFFVLVFFIYIKIRIG